MNTEKLLADRYRIVDKVGSGGMAIVYRAEDIKTNRSVAIKILKPEFNEDKEFCQRFQREADSISQMTHHNIVNLLDVGIENGHRYLVMEYVQGRTLKEVIREKGRMSPEVAAQIAIRILAALKHAHQNGIIHRDIKPQNILVHDDGHIKVADFGIATKMDSQTLAHTDNVMGSVHYISPEQASGKEVGVTGDIYSVGVVMYEMLTGRVPYDGDTVVAVAMQHLRGAPTPIYELAPNVPKGLIYVVNKAMAKEPKNRYQSAFDMASDIRAAIAGELNNELEPGPQPKENPVSRRMKKMDRPPIRRGLRIPRSRVKKGIQIGMMVLMTLLVFGGLVLGGIGIYNNIMHSATAPDLVGLEENAALRAVQKEGIKAELIYAHHPSIQAGQVILQAPAYEAKMSKGDTIVLTISKGPNVFTVPELTGNSSADAVAALQKIGVVLTVVERVVSAESVDTILTQTPAAGETIAAGGSVQVTVSGGIATVPDLSQMTVEEAVQAILAAGLTPGSKENLTTTEAQRVGQVATQRPQASSQVVQGAIVSVAVYEAMRYRGELSVTLPQSSQGVQVKVNYVKPDGTEEEQYSAMHAANEEEDFTHEVLGDAPGEAVYRLYLNGEMSEEVTVVLE